MLESLPLELRIEAVKNAGNLFFEYLKRFNDRTPIIEQYLQGMLTLHIHGLLAGRPYCLGLAKTEGDSDTWISNEKMAMFVGVGQLPKGARPFAASKWLQPLDSCLVSDAETFQIVSMYPGFLLIPSLWPTFNRKLRALLDFPRIQDGELVNEVIKGRPHIVDCFTDEDANARWYVRIDGIHEHAGEPGWDTNGNLWVRLPEGVQHPLQVTQVLICPSYSRITIVKRWLHGVSLEYEERLQTAEAEDPTGVRDSRTHTGRVRVQPEKDSQAWQVIVSESEEVASRTSPVPRSGGCTAKHTRLGSPEDA